MEAQWDQRNFIEQNFCDISIAIRMGDEPFLCLVENDSGWEGAFAGTLRPAPRAAVPGFSVYHGSNVVAQIAAARVRDNDKLRQQIIKPCEESEGKVLILYTKDGEYRITCIDLQLVDTNHQQPRH
jgi:hypothetical protein